MRRNGIIVFQLGHFYTQMEVTQVKPNSVEHIAKRIAPVKIILIILISDIDTKSRSMHLQLKIILIKESLVDLHSWVVGFGDFWNCPV